MNRSGAENRGRWRDSVELSLALAMALSLPWELYQRIPYVEVTITKAAGALLVMVAAGRIVCERRWRVEWTGLEAPFLALLTVMAATTAASADRAASVAQWVMYASYFVIFCAVSGVAYNAARARWLAGAFVASSAAVGVLAIACRLGLATPTLVDTTRITGRWTTREAWFDLTSRMAPASADFNQGVLPLLLAFCLVLFLFLARKKGHPRAALAAGLLALAGIVISLSRSSILLAVLLGGVFVVLGLRRGARGVVAGFAASALVAVLVLVIAMGPAGVMQRARQMFEGRDSSYESRIAAFEAGVSLLPEYWLTGTGLGASDGVIARSAYGARVGGITIHSVPFKLLVETGVAGLAALLWFYWRALRMQLRGLKRSDAEARAHSVAFLVLGVTLFLITAVQPFMALALFPFLLGIAAGPLAGSGREPGEAGSCQPGRAWTAAITVCVAGTVVFNILDFHRTVERLGGLADTLVMGALAERSGDLQEAGHAYVNAFSMTAGSEQPGGSEPVAVPRYYQQAADVLDVAYAYGRMGVRCRRVNAAAAAAYGAGRVALAEGRYDDVTKWLAEAVKRDGRFAQAYFTLAETLWEMGEYKKAVDHYGRARDLEVIRENAEFRQFIAPLDEFIGRNEGSADIATTLRRAESLRRRGRWPEAVDAYANVLEREPACAEALFNLGVQREIDGMPEKAAEFYARALESAGGHYESARRLALLHGENNGDGQCSPTRRRGA